MAALGRDRRVARLHRLHGGGQVARRRARRATAGLEVVDTDELLERELGMPIDEFFAAARRGGVPAPRGGAFVERLLERADGGVIALGGGSVLSEQRPRGARPPRRRLAARSSRETAWERVAGKRPLARDRERFEALLAERAADLRVARRRRPAAGRRRSPRARAAVARSRSASCRRDAARLGAERLRATTRSSSAAACSRAGSGRSDGGRFLITDTDGRRRCYARARSSRSRRADRGRAGRGGEDARRGRAGAGRAGARPG